MSALYVMRFAGQADAGAGAMVIAKGVFLGVDAGNVRYHGTYTETDGRLKASGQLTAGQGGATLVTGQHLPEGQSIAITADFPTDFANGAVQSIDVMGRPVRVTFEKIGDIP